MVELVPEVVAGLQHNPGGGPRAPGGVGSCAVQLARAAGAQVAAVCSGAKAGYVRSLGAGSVLDYGERDVADGGTVFDLVLVDLIGAGSVVPSIDRVLPLAHAAEALELLASGAVRGKLVLTV
ncbi:zinc-binding dehydrogenase [Arthrobacter sp. TmT3-37]